MVTEAELLAAVEAAFDVARGGLEPWPDPHFGGQPLDEEYSRVMDPGKWRIVGARADAWLTALAEAGLAVVERGSAVQWRSPPGPVIARADRLVPHAVGALPLVVARSRIGDVPDAGVTLGVGEPAVGVTWIPYCGCDACDRGAQEELDQLDASILAVVRGVFRRLTQGDRVITVFGHDTRFAAGFFGPREVPAVLAEPRGWDELSGASWLGERRPRSS